MKERHGIPAIVDLTSLARHEAGHLLMLWLLACYAASVSADGCGVTQVLDEFAAKRRRPISQYDLLLG